MKKLMKYLKPYWFLALLAPLFMVGEVILDLMLPQLMKYIVDDGILSNVLSASEKTSVVIKYGSFMLICLVVGGLCGLLCSFFATATANNFGNDLRKVAFSRVVDLSFEQKDMFTTGSLVTRITNDITQVQDFVSMALRMLIRTVVMFIGGIIFMFLTSVTFAIILAVVLPIQAIIIFIFLKKIRPLFTVVQSKIDKVNSVVQENVNGIRVVKAYNNEEKECKRFDESNVSLAQTNLKVQKTMAMLQPIIILILNTIVISIIYFSGLEIDKNTSLILAGSTDVLSVGMVMSGLTYVTMVLMSVIMLAFFTQYITRATVSAKRINEILDSKPVVVNCSEALSESVANGLVEFRNVSFTYPGSSKPVIDKYSFRIESGSSVAILGATGVGKTTLINLLPRFYEVSQGEILIGNYNIKDYDLDVLRKNVSVVLQKTEMFSGTILENILWGDNNASMEEVIEVCKISQSLEFIESFKDGFNTIIGERGSTLSGGQKQRLAIARALLRKPKVLIFDDSTSALDLLTESKLYQELKNKLKNTTLIIIAQRVASARNCNKIIVLDDCCIDSYGTHEELIQSSSIYQDIYNSQLKRGEVNE